jgi:hypothetical protein
MLPSNVNDASYQQSEQSPNLESQDDSSEDEPMPVIEEKTPPPANPPGKEVVIKSKRKRTAKKLFTTDDPTVKVRVRQRKAGRPKGPKIVTVYKEDLVPEQTKVVVQAREETPPKVHYPPVKPLGKRDLMRMQKEEEIAKLEEVAGRVLLKTRKGDVDRRSIVKRTVQQIAATKRMLEANSLRRQKLADARASLIARETVKELAGLKHQYQPTQTRAPEPTDRVQPVKPQTMQELFA